MCSEKERSGGVQLLTISPQAGQLVKHQRNEITLADNAVPFFSLLLIAWAVINRMIMMNIDVTSVTGPFKSSPTLSH